MPVKPGYICLRESPENPQGRKCLHCIERRTVIKSYDSYAHLCISVFILSWDRKCRIMSEVVIYMCK